MRSIPHLVKSSRYYIGILSAPSAPENVATEVVSSSSVNVAWTMPTDSYETGPFVNYIIEATASGFVTATTEATGRYKYIQGVT